MINIGLYTLFFTPGQIGGIETYIRQLIQALGQVDQQNHYTLFVSEQNRAVFTDLSYPNFKQVTISITPPRNPLPLRVLRKLKIIPSYISQQLYQHPIDLIHYLGTTIDQLDLKIPCALTVHDIQQEYFPEFFSKEELAWRQATFKPSAQKARRIITDAAFSRQTLIDKYQIPADKIDVVHLGIGQIFHSNISLEDIQTIRNKYSLPEQFIYFPANPWPHKNHARLFQALTIVREQYNLSCPLVLTGAFETNQSELQDIIAQTHIADLITPLGYLPYEDLPALYSAATALVFPSLFEGFGMPVLEAMACGCPVICSNTTSLPELVGKAALLIDPTDVGQIAKAIYDVVNSEPLQQELRQKGLKQVSTFSWLKTAQKTVEVYEKVLPR